MRLQGFCLWIECIKNLQTDVCAARSRGMKRRHFLHSGMGLTFWYPLFAALNEGKLEKAAAVLTKATESKQVHAASLLFRQGGCEFAKTFGAAAGSVYSMFLLASITKPICIASVMTLFDKGEFALNDPVKKVHS